MHEQPGLSEELLQACLQEQYDLSPVTLESLSGGLDYSAGVYRVVNEQGTAYALKATSRPLYKAGHLVPRYLNDQGITAVVAPMPTKSGALWAKLSDWTVLIYPFLEGDTSFTGMTNEQWRETGAIFKRIHQVWLPPEGFESLRKETFDPTEYTRWVHTFEARHLDSLREGSEALRSLRSSWMAQQFKIHMGISLLEKLAKVLQARTYPYVICHADLHPANLLRDRHGHVFVLDWDEVMLAPGERDFIFIREPQADAFWEGYGQREIDWVVLSYYLWERVIQDVIEDARSVCFRQDWTEETRAEVVRFFQEYLTAGGGSNIGAAYAALIHLPAKLTIDSEGIS